MVCTCYTGHVTEMITLTNEAIRLPNAYFWFVYLASQAIYDITAHDITEAILTQPAKP